MNLRIFLAFLSIVSLATCSSNAAFPEIADYYYLALGKEMVGTFWNTFRLPASEQRVIDLYHEPRVAGMDGSIPLAYAGYHGRNICGRGNDPNCEGWLVGEELLKNPALEKRVLDWLGNLCDELPPNVSDDPGHQYISVGVRRNEVSRLRQFIGCEAGNRGVGDRLLHIYFVKDLDTPMNPALRPIDAIRQLVVAEKIVRLNPKGST